ncbi:hypothetical protein BIW11_12109 [Tropilaelaps mercedesae]|uniref:Uncharacterized protein n=1 Tax=Tropilaelaps mercedesae TaxID=418985 RepID=A0A1V9X7Z8_9ACAR|nr:hypothetical protein BIW11_12109 [Tropilaelaps mercedesae]
MAWYVLLTCGRHLFKRCIFKKKTSEQFILFSLVKC